MAILITIIGFGIMVVLHELGHFITAKKFGVLVHEFAIGMGPKIVSFQKGETKYSIRLFPIGGYVKLEGENELEENDNPRSFSNLHPLKRIIVLVSGALMNILLGFLIFTIINLSVGVVPSKIDSIPTELSDRQTYLKSGDEVLKLNNTRVRTNDDVLLFMSRYDGKEPISITFERNGEKTTVKDFYPIKTNEGYKLGVIFKQEKASLLKSSEFAIYDTIHITKAVIFAVGDLIGGKMGINALSGPVEIVTVVDSVATADNNHTLLSVLLLFAMITVNLGVFNLLPFPALDGGSIIFAIYELITRKKVKSEIVGYASMIGFVLLMTLAVFVTAGDIVDIFK